MVKQTVMLFIKATIIGILVNVGLDYLPTTTMPTDETGTIIENEAVIKPIPGNTELSAN